MTVNIAEKFVPKNSSILNFFSGNELKTFLAEKGTQTLDYTTPNVKRIDNVGNLPKSGHVMIINLGTSGNFWLHAPNAYVKQARVNANQACSVPGDLLLPQAELRRHGLDYMECGPTGWEELIVIVAPTSLINETDIFEASNQNPFVQMPLSRMEKLITELDTMPPDAVALGALGFVVRD